MPRPADHYAHAQFEPVESDFQGETVRCLHCKHWTGSIKTLNRKKDHLLKCPAYAAWRQAGNGQDLAPPNKYSKRDSATMNDADLYSSPQAGYTPNMQRSRLLDLNKYFDEFWDDSAQQKCMRCRCKYCGFVRAKNTTRQFEHLQQCGDFLNSNDGQQAAADGLLTLQPVVEVPPSTSTVKGDIFRGSAPNPNLTFKSQLTKHRLSGGRQIATPVRPGPPKPAPSLINHLLAKNQALVEESTQLHFLSHAGCGTLSKNVLQQWLTQQGHMSRSLTTFIGGLISKIRLTDTPNPSLDPNWRALDLLVSAVNNAKRELEFLRATHVKYGLQPPGDPPKPATKGFIDLFAAASSPTASLLEGLVVLWVAEHLYCVSWQYAGNFISAAPPAATSYTIPTYLQQQQGHYDMSNPYGPPPPSFNPENSHIAALHEALIPNWTSMGFIKFVDACKSIVDELANAQTTGNGAVELNNCESNFRQAVWLWKQIFPEVTGMGEEAEPIVEAPEPPPTTLQTTQNGSSEGNRIEIADDDDDDDAGRDEDAPTSASPYGGTGLDVVAAANRAS